MQLSEADIIRNKSLDLKYIQEEYDLLEKKVKSLRDEYYGPEKSTTKQLMYISKMLAEHPEHYYDKYHETFIAFCFNLHDLESNEQSITNMYNEIYDKQINSLNKCNYCGGEFKMNDYGKMYCSKCKRVVEEECIYVSEYVHARTPKTRDQFRLQDNAFKNLYRLNLPLNLRQKAAEYFGSNPWDKEKMCECLTKAAEEYGYNEYNSEYFRKLYKLGKCESYTEKLERKKERTKRLKNSNYL